MAVHYLVNFVFLEYQFRVFDVVGIPYATPSLFGFELNTPMRWYFFLLALVALTYVGLSNTLRSREGRALLAMRDHERAAMSAGVDVRVLRIKAFGLTSAIAGVAGALYAYYLSNATSESFGISFAIQFIAMIIIGGMGSLKGALIGAAVWLLLPRSSPASRPRLVAVPGSSEACSASTERNSSSSSSAARDRAPDLRAARTGGSGERLQALIGAKGRA